MPPVVFAPTTLAIRMPPGCRVRRRAGSWRAACDPKCESGGKQTRRDSEERHQTQPLLGEAHNLVVGAVASSFTTQRH